MVIYIINLSKQYLIQLCVFYLPVLDSFALQYGRKKWQIEIEKETEVGPSQRSSNAISYPIYLVRSVLCIVSVSSRLLKIYSK